MPARITAPLRKLLAAFMVDPSVELYGLDLIDATKLRSGTLYPLLHRLVIDGWLERSGPVPSDSGGAPRYFYKLTGVGAGAAAELLGTADVPPIAPSPRLAPRPGRVVRGPILGTWTAWSR
jgi:DNA-binding PadR family transcriptional regulator